MQDFKQIRAWQRAHALAMKLHELTSRYSRSGHANLRGQLTRAMSAVAANIAEGCGSASNREFARYLDIAIKSANEVEYHLLSARDLRVMPVEVWQPVSIELIEIRKMIYGYRMRVIANDQR